MTLKKPRTHRFLRWPRLSAVLGTVVALTWLDGCVAGGAVRLEAPRPLGEELVWPAPPDPPRIRHLRSFGSATDLGFRRSFFGRVVDFVRGRDGSERLQHPYGVAVTDDDRIYVVDSGARAVHLYDLPNGRHRTLHPDELVHPIDVAVAADGSVFVSDSEGGQVLVLDADGDVRGRITDGLSRPTGIALNPVTGALYVADTERHEVRIFDADGTPLGRFGQRGAGLGELNYPTLIALGPTGHVYVSDALNFRIQVFEEDGTPVRSFGRLGDAVGEFARPKGLGVDSQGRVYVVEGLYDVVNVFDREGRLLMTFGGPGQRDGTFWLATGLAVDQRNRIFVADSYNGRVQAFQLISAGVP